MIGTVTKLIELHMIGYDTGWSDGAVRRLIRRAGPENMNYLLSFRRADLLAHGLIDHKMYLLSELEKRVGELSSGPIARSSRDLAIDGNRVMESLGLRPGPDVGRVLNELMEKVTDHPELNTEEGLVALLDSILTQDCD
jgi:hypothetical protein